MDFFAVVPDQSVSVSGPAPAVDPFAEAIASRFGSPADLLTARLTSGPLPVAEASKPSEAVPAAMSHASPSRGPSASPAAHSFVALPPRSLHTWLDDPSSLVLDIRPHAAYSSARIPRAVSLSVPSTLLKRPLFSLHRLSAMLPSPAARVRFSAWRSAARILVYDADSSAIPDSSNICGLLRKFKADGFTGELAWLQGGFQAVWRERKDLIDTHPPTVDDQENDEDTDDVQKPSPASSVLRPRHLPMSAFSLSSTIVHNSPHFNPASHPTKRPPATNYTLPLSLSTPSHTSYPAVNPFFDTIRQNIELSHGITDRITLRLPRRVRRRINDLPFPWLQNIARRAAKSAPHHRPTDSTSSASEESEDDDSPDSARVEEGTEALAMQFYRIELAEQRRLMGIMEHHSKESGNPADHPMQPAVAFPFSITAGVEKGAKNRYRHIWPFEHARVRLHQKREADDDYVNASFVQPLGTTKRYIATQGPLPATFVDFWTLCWEQNVHVIVMLTREVEGSMVKCANYWNDTCFGPLRLRHISTTGVVSPLQEPSLSGFFTPRSPFNTAQPQSKPHHRNKSETIKRVFELTHTGYPDAKPRKIVHLQYLDWPDMNVPEDPRGLLALIREVEDAVKETGVRDEPTPSLSGLHHRAGAPMDMDEKTGISKLAAGKNSPVLLHCSAGVGRTGGFIIVDAVLDAIRRELRSKKTQHQPKREADDMDVDVAPVAVQPTAPLTVGNNINGNETVHVPLVAPKPVRRDTLRDGLKTPMQIDSEETDVSESDRDQSRERSTSAFAPDNMTRRWVENVSAETGVSNNTASTKDTSKTSVTRSSPTRSSPSTVDDSAVGSEDSAFGFKHSGSYHHPSSSLATSVSGNSSSSYKVPLTPNASNSEAPSSAPGIMLPAFASANAEQRLRTFSAPTGGNMQLALQARQHANTTGGIGMTSSAQSSTPAAWLMDTKVSSPLSFSNQPKPLGLSKPSDLSNLAETPAQSSDSEIPSRSQSPSADEASLVGSRLSKANTNAVSMNASVVVQPPTQDSTVSSWTAESAKTFDYKEPRSLHTNYYLPSLSTFEDPIWEVVQDMREQRMSLCQSLRQYVFVHAAIIEGALMVVDEENDGKTPGISAPSGFDFSSHKLTLSPPIPMPFPSWRTHGSDGSRSASSSSTGKRRPSLTELLKEGSSGEWLKAKRPSIKRKQRSGDDPDQDSSRSAPFQRVQAAQAQLAADGSGSSTHRSPSLHR